MRNFDSLASATAALAQFGYVYAATGPNGYGFTKGKKFAVVSPRGKKFVVKFI